MNEDEWHRCTDPAEMLEHLLTIGASPRKMRLFEIACCRRVEHLVVAELRDLLKVAERLADGLADSNERKQARAAALKAHWIKDENAKHARGSAKQMICETLARRPKDSLKYVAQCTANALATYAGNLHYASTKQWSQEARDSAYALELKIQADLLREVFGNPFAVLPAPPTMDQHLLQQIYQGDWTMLKKCDGLLRAAGFPLQAQHCLRPASLHVKGCWLIDWLMGIP